MVRRAMVGEPLSGWVGSWNGVDGKLPSATVHIWRGKKARVTRLERTLQTGEQLANGASVASFSKINIDRIGDGKSQDIKTNAPSRSEESDRPIPKVTFVRNDAILLNIRTKCFFACEQLSKQAFLNLYRMRSIRQLRKTLVPHHQSWYQ